MGKLAVLMVTAFIDMAGVLMVLPLLPFYAKSMGAGGLVVGIHLDLHVIGQGDKIFQMDVVRAVPLTGGSGFGKD